MSVSRAGGKHSSRQSPGSVAPKLPRIAEDRLEMMRPPPDALRRRETLPMGPADPAAAAVVADRGSLQAIGEAASGAVRRACEGLTHLSSCCRREALPAQDPLEAAQAERHRLQEQLLLAGSGPANQSPMDRVANAFATRRAQARLRTLDAEIPRLMDTRLRQVMADGDELIRRGASGIDLDENADEQVLLLEDMAQEQRRQAPSQPASPLQADDDAEQKW